VDENDDLASLGELDTVREKVQEHLAEAGLVAEDPGGRDLVDEAAELDPLLPCARRDDVQRALHALAQTERLPLEVEFAGLDLRVVEDVVDYVKERVSARPDDLGELALLARQLSAKQEIGHPDHGLHRRPDLVAHRGEEGTLGLRRRLGFLAGALELGDVVVDAEEAHVRAVHGERDEHQLDVDEGSVSALAPGDPLRPALSDRFPHDLAPFLAAGVAEDEVIEGPAESFLCGVAEELGRSWVPVGHPLVGVEDDHRGGTDGDERLEVAALSLHLGEKACVLDRNADVGRDRRQQAGVGFAEPALLIDALDADYADRRVANEDRHAQERPHAGAKPRRLVLLEMRRAVEKKRLARLEDTGRQPLAVRDRSFLAALPALVVVDEVDPSRWSVVEGNIGDISLERLAHLLADELDQRVEVELRRERLADAVHGRELGHPLARLVDEAALSSATLRLLASVVKSRWSSSPKACVRSTFCSDTTPVARPPSTRGTKSADLGGFPLSTTGLS
jgi:hypothetical protein